MKRANHGYDFLPLMLSMIVILGFMLSATAWAASEAIGSLAEVQGQVELNGVAVQAGAELRLGMRVVTGAESRAVLKFADGQVVALRSESVFWIKNYRYASKPENSRSATELLKGGMRFISGAIAKENPQAVRIDTPVATIGVRGTEFTAVLGSLYLLVHQGTVLVTAAGVTVTANPGEMVFVRGANSPPRKVPAPELGSQCDSLQRDGAAPEDTRTIGCTSSSLLATVPAGVVSTPAAGIDAAAAAASAAAVAVGAILREEVRKDDPKASP
jgi:hypothetical protein